MICFRAFFTSKIHFVPEFDEIFEILKAILQPFERDIYTVNCKHER